MRVKSIPRPIGSRALRLRPPRREQLAAQRALESGQCLNRAPAVAAPAPAALDLPEPLRDHFGMDAVGSAMQRQSHTYRRHLTSWQQQPIAPEVVKPGLGAERGEARQSIAALARPGG